MLLVGAGFFEVYRGVRCRRRRQSKVAIVCLGVATLVLVLLLLFPQVMASALADISSGAR